MALYFLIGSCVLQAVVALLAIRVALQRAAVGWIVVAVALTLMLGRRAFTLEQTLSSAYTPSPLAELTALLISLLLTLGFALFARRTPPEGEETVGDAAQAATERVKRQAVALSCVGLAGTAMLAYLIYAATAAAVTQRLSRSSMELARVLSASAAQAQAAGKDPLQQLQTLWDFVHPRDRYICVIGHDGRLRFHSLRPDRVGVDVGATRLDSNEKPGAVRDLRALITERGDWSGRNTSFGGHAQIAAFTYNSAVDGLIAIHIPAAHIATEIWRGMFPWLLAFAGVLLIVLPASIMLLYRASSRSQAAARLAQRRTLASEDRYRQIVETTHDGVWVIDAEGHTTFANRRLATMLGSTPDALAGSVVFDYVDAADRRKVEAYLERRRRGIAEVHELRLLKRGGGDLDASLSTNPLFDDHGRYAGSLAMVTDITERRRLEDQLREAQKMDAIGRLAGGIAHDFNNLLTVIQFHAGLLCDEDTDVDASKEHARGILTAADTAADLTRGLLAFSRKRVVSQASLDLNEIVGKMAEMLRRILREDVDFQSEYAPQLPRIRGNASMIEQVIMNLVVNARDAMPQGGRLRIATRCETESAVGAEAQPSSLVCLEVSDTGAGIGPELLPHIFEPFYTTKQLGRGTGLGLATVYGIVKQHGGYICVESVHGRGTTFTLRFPCDRGGELEAGAPEAANVWPRGDATILMVEDDALVRPLVTDALRRCGYRVLSASAGSEALEHWNRHAHEIGVLLTDLLMPGGMTGRDLALRLRGMKPELEVIFMSGYGADLLDGVEDELPDAAFIQKPCTPAELAAFVSRHLARGSRRGAYPSVEGAASD